ncbi:hypothetical protein BJX65DRAFT_287954 [Aspergillus insuetus]
MSSSSPSLSVVAILSGYIPIYSPSLSWFDAFFGPSIVILAMSTLLMPYHGNLFLQSPRLAYQALFSSVHVATSSSGCATGTGMIEQELFSPQQSRTTADPSSEDSGSSSFISASIRLLCSAARFSSSVFFAL